VPWSNEGEAQGGTACLWGVILDGAPVPKQLRLPKAVHPVLVEIQISHRKVGSQSGPTLQIERRMIRATCQVQRPKPNGLLF
jgi:hypothetical protein